MTVCRKWASIAIVISCAAVAASHSMPAQVSADPSQSKTAKRSRLVRSHPLPKMDGDHLKVSVVEVAYGPGDSSAPHSHPCPVVGYVVEGALRMQVKGRTRSHL